MSTNATHVISTDKENHTSHLSRQSNGMVIAWRNKNQIMYGENPRSPECREFVSEDCALEAMRHIATVDQGERCGKFCKDCGMPPAQVLTCPNSNDGAHRIDTRRVPDIEIVDAGKRIARVM